jgi:hypothetical protein
MEPHWKLFLFQQKEVCTEYVPSHPSLRPWSAPLCLLGLQAWRGVPAAAKLPLSGRRNEMNVFHSFFFQVVGNCFFAGGGNLKWFEELPT